MKKFIFDVDGTITPSRKVIDTNFKSFFNTFCLTNHVYLVTGSDKAKTIEQIGEDTYNLCKRVYQCNGNDVWQGNKNISKTDWYLKDHPHEWLSEQLTLSDFPIRTGNHFEHRSGMVNFSIVGRNANQTERAHYVKWDKERDERKNIAETFNYMFPTLEARVGGETGIDISMKGLDKSQILKDFFDNDVLHFFGDAMYSGGNDAPLATSIIDKNIGFCYNIQNWKDTWDILKTL
jgi:phosphomannomutase